ncbi:MAG: 16S rRNA (uracil(1498)-N(3))-methyltransferase [Firmicutes bacterium]|nr:16S rRNA (uracil(1498)-N(3))-methyltransferase [Bacillota bacterium]
MVGSVQYSKNKFKNIDKSLRRFFVDKIENRVVLDGENHHHLANVLRLKVGDEIILCPNDGFDYHFLITSIKKNESDAKLIRQEKNLSTSDIEITLYFASLKGDNSELVVQKAVELGVKNIIVFTSQFTNNKNINLARLNKISENASKQSGRANLVKVEFLLFEEVLKRLPTHSEHFFFYEKEKIHNIRSHISEKGLYKNSSIIVGSEGGFSEDEVGEIEKLKIKPLSLGKLILRAETASIAALSIVMHELGHLE